jgi:hypothetical protein
MQVDGNAYFKEAKPFADETNHLMQRVFDPAIKINQ